MKINSIAFGAKFRDTRTIVKQRGHFKENYNVAFVELSAKSKKDVDAIINLIEPWGGFNSYTFDIAKDMHDILSNYKQPSALNFPRFFAYTKQAEDFKHINEKDILGITEISFPKPNEIKINCLETSPLYRAEVATRPLKHIGTSLVKTIQEMFEGFSIFLCAEKNRVSFYKNLGFKNLQNNQHTSKLYFKKL